MRRSWWKKFLNIITLGSLYCKIFGHTKSKDKLLGYTTWHNYYKYGFCSKCSEMHIVGWFDPEGFLSVEDAKYSSCKSVWKKEKEIK